MYYLKLFCVLGDFLGEFGIQAGENPTQEIAGIITGEYLALLVKCIICLHQ